MSAPVGAAFFRPPRVLGAEIAEVGSQAWNAGDKIYRDNTNRRATTVATDNTAVGVAVRPVGNGAEETLGRVRLNASF